MSKPLEYDEAEARQETAIHETSSASERREAVRGLLEPRTGEDVLSIGCGPGFEPVELAPLVGEEGQVLGVDRSEAMLALAARRCDGLPQVALARGDAVDLPVADESVDAALAVQVYEYIDDVDAAIGELHRVLRPGGRAVLCDADWTALVWRSADRERMARILDAFDDHCPRPRLGSELAPHLRGAGLTVECVEPYTILDTRLDGDSFAAHLAEFVREYAAAHDDVGPAEADAWLDDLRDHGAAGETFFSYTQYCYLVRKPE